MDASIGLTHFTSAAIVVYVINKLKAATWFPLLQKDKVILNRGFSAVTALCISLGVTYVWTPVVGGGHQLVLTIPSLSVLALGIWHWLNQYAMQETLHQMVKPKVVAPDSVGKSG